MLQVARRATRQEKGQQTFFSTPMADSNKNDKPISVKNCLSYAPTCTL
jgi:hypothetical protein